MKYTMQTRRRARGLTLLEVGMALALSAIVITGMAMYASSAAQKMKRRGDAQHLAVVAQASEAYLVKHQGDLLASGGALDPTRHALGTIVEVPVSQLVSDGELSPSVSSKFGDGQNLELMLQAIANPAYQPPPASQTVPQYLVKGLVISYGGIAFTDDQAGEIVNLTGAAGGYPSTKVDTHNIDGSGGAWQEPLASWNRGVTHPAATGHVMALVGMSFGAAGTTTDDRWLAREVIDQGAAPYPHNTMQTDINMNDTLASHNSYSLLGASSVQANEYVGQTPGADINIGSITATPNINIGSANSTNQILLQTMNPLAPGAPVHMAIDGNGLELGAVGGGGLTLPTTGVSTWSAEDAKISLFGGGGATTIMSTNANNAELDLNTPAVPPFGTGAPTPVMNLNANGDGSSIKLNANGNDSSLELNAYGTSNDKITLNAAGAGNNNSINLIASTYAGNQHNTGSINITPGQAGYFNLWDASNSWGMEFAPAPPASVYGDDTFLMHALTYTFSIPCDKCTHSQYPSHWAPMMTANYDPSDGDQGGRVEVYFGDINIDQAAANIHSYWVDSYGATKLSDRRLKYDIQPLPDALSKIEQLNGYSYKLKRNHSAHLGVIAQEVQKVYPQSVTVVRGMGSGTAQYLGVSYDDLIAPLIEAVKTLHHMLDDAITTFKSQIATLQQDDLALKEQNAALKAELAQQQLELIKLKYAIHQPLSADERTLCGVACAP